MFYRVLTWLMGACVLVLCLACGKSESPDSTFGAPGTQCSYFTDNGTPTTQVRIDSSVPSDQRQYLTNDFQNVEILNISHPPSGNDACYLGLTDFTGSSLSLWLRQRVKVIVGEDFDYVSNANGTSLSSFQPVLASENLSASNIVTLMFNLGSHLYRTGKKNNTVYSLAVGSQSITVKSPRSGIIQIGEGLFSSTRISGKSYNSVGSSLLRIGVLFHEARHSDGNGTNAGFPHAQCTSGTYAGRSSCENNLNGPYNIEAILLTSFYNSCGASCDSTEKQALQLAIADSKSRLLSNPVFSDVRPERLP